MGRTEEMRVFIEEGGFFLGVVVFRHAWRIPWMEEPGKVQSMGCKESDMTE